MIFSVRVINTFTYAKAFLLLRVKQANLVFLEEMGCLAKKEYMDYQESRFEFMSYCSLVAALLSVFFSVLTLCNLFLRALQDLQARLA